MLLIQINLFLSLLLCLLVSGPFTTLAQQQKPNGATAHESPGCYKWETWNYYQILGLAPESYYHADVGLPSRRKRSNERSKITATDIKKAYRTQAQLWHPDKVASKKQQTQQTVRAANVTSQNSKDYSDISIEESNARFARIAQAYEILSDQGKREEYDVYLLDREDEMELERRYHPMKQDTPTPSQHEPTPTTRSSQEEYLRSFFNTFKTDPLALFEEFFFKTSSHGSTHVDEEFMKGSTQ